MSLPIVCNLGALSPAQREREQHLLAEFKSWQRDARPIDAGYSFEVPDEPATLARLGEFLALERLCCPFLRFRLAVGFELAPVVLEVSGDDDAAQAFVRDTFVK
jgi:hypothetical protein